MNKIVSGIEKIVGGFLIEGEGIDEGEVAQKIYNNRKEIGLFTLDDIEIDEKKLIKIIQELRGHCLNLTGAYSIIAKAIADNNPIKVKK